MCICEIKNELGQSAQIDMDSLWIYDSDDSFLCDFKINFCPVCGESKKDLVNQQINERLKEISKENHVK